MKKLKIAVVIPCYNEQENIVPMHRRLTKVFKSLPYEYEFVFVNNGSTDESERIFTSLVKKDRNTTVIQLSRNFYKSQGAYTAGLDYSHADCVVLLDGDLQDPPEVIPDLIKKWKMGYKVVYGVRIKRNESVFRRLMYKLFYRIFHKLSYMQVPVDAGDFSLIDQKVVEIFRLMPERNRYIRGLRAWVGFKSIGVDYERLDRNSGFTTNSFINNVQWAAFAIFSFSYAPLGLISWIAFFTVGLAGIAIVVYSALYFIYPGAPKGFQTLLLATLFLGGIQLICFSIIAQYMGIMFDEIKGRPKYIVESILKKK